ncbi:hypothetical protein B0H21DRAFT_818240 [Amylocystis lapponica]|nr:hypothetical protein B0H21DRAFT_818240 [Amylocystis lapponica]
MEAQHIIAYRAIVREVNKASSQVTRNGTIASSFRAVFEARRRGDHSEHFDHDVGNVITFLQSQRMHKALLERYNPLHDLTAEQRIHATARRVGLDMPDTVQGDEKK